MKVVYPELAAEIARRGIRKKDIAKCIQISDRSLSNKMQGKSAFTWNEVERIGSVFFPGMELSELFKVASETAGR